MDVTMSWDVLQQQSLHATAVDAGLLCLNVCRPHGAPASDKSERVLAHLLILTEPSCSLPSETGSTDTLPLHLMITGRHITWLTGMQGMAYSLDLCASSATAAAQHAALCLCADRRLLSAHKAWVSKHAGPEGVVGGGHDFGPAGSSSCKGSLSRPAVPNHVVESAPLVQLPSPVVHDRVRADDEDRPPPGHPSH